MLELKSKMIFVVEDSAITAYLAPLLVWLSID